MVWGRLVATAVGKSLSVDYIKDFYERVPGYYNQLRMNDLYKYVGGEELHIKRLHISLPYISLLVFIH